MDDIEAWRLRRQLTTLRDAKGAGTSMISLIIPPNDAISRYTRLLTEEYGTASNIKSRVNRLSVLGAITSAQQKLKTYTVTPKNGLAVFAGTIMIDGKEKRVAYGLEPLRPINTSLYLCDARFHVNDLVAQFDSERVFGFCIMDGHGTLLAQLQGNVKQILQTMQVSLPKKHARGGQSSVRFARLRVEKRLTYCKKVAELMTATFLCDNKCNVDGIILAGHSDLKVQMKEHLDARLSKNIIKIVDTNYGGEPGLNEAIADCAEALSDVKLAREQAILNHFFESVRNNTGLFSYGLEDTMQLLNQGAVETLILYEDSPLQHENLLLVDWIAENHSELGCKIELVSNKSSEGSQFVEGFGGIGAVLRYKVDLVEDGKVYENIDSDEIF